MLQDIYCAANGRLCDQDCTKTNANTLKNVAVYITYCFYITYPYSGLRYHRIWKIRNHKWLRLFYLGLVAKDHTVKDHAASPLQDVHKIRRCTLSNIVSNSMLYHRLVTGDQYQQCFPWISEKGIKFAFDTNHSPAIYELISHRVDHWGMRRPERSIAGFQNRISLTRGQGFGFAPEFFCSTSPNISFGNQSLSACGNANRNPFRIQQVTGWTALENVQAVINR